MSDNKNDWRSRVKAMMTDPNYAEKMASVVDDTRKVNTNLMNKSEEFESSLSLNQPKQEPLDLARVEQMKSEDAARATMPSEDDNYSGVSDLATKLYAEERNKRIGKALQGSNDTYFGAPHGMRFSQAAEVISDVEKAKRVQGIYDKVLQDESVAQAIRINADKALSKAMEQNQSMNEDEQKKVYDESVNKQLEAIGKGIDKYLYDINAPKSEAEWIAKNAVNSSIMGQMLTSPMNVEGGENAYRQQALADYGAKASWLSQGVSMAGSLIIDTLPMMGIGTAFAAPASKAAMWGVGKVGGKALQGSLIGRGVVGSVGGAATLGGYNAASALTTQFSNGQFDLGEITSSAGHGVLMGGLTGVMSPVLRGVSQGMGKVGKAATMTGGLGAEAGIFSAAELAEMENPYDFETIAQTFGKNVVVIGGLKLSNPIKTIGEYKRWYNEGKQSNFNDADYKMMADFAKAKGFANSEAFSMSADGVYSRSIADRVTGNRTLLELTKLEGGKERNLAIEMYNDPNVPISLKTKIAAKMNLPAPKPLLANGVRVEGNKAITYCTMPNGAQQVIEIKEFQRPRNARAFANEFSRTTARKNDLMQIEAAVNNISTEPIVIARLNEQAKRNGTTYEEELARLNDIVQRAAEGTITSEDVAYYTSIVDTDISATEAIKQGIKDEYDVEIDDVLKSDGNLTDAQDKAMTAYADALRVIVEQGNPTTERMLVASTSGVADYVALNRLDIEQTRGILTNLTRRAEIDAQMRSKYGAWLKYFDGKMGEDALAAKLGYDLNNSTDLQNFLAEQTYFKNKAADRIAANTIDVAKQLLEQGGRGVRFTEGGKVKLQGVPYPVEVSQEIVDRYDAAMQGSGEPMSRIINDALKDIIKQSETPSAPKEPIMEAPDATEQPMSDADAITQQMVDARIAEIDTDLQGIDADGVQRMTINGRPVAIIKGRIVADADGKVDKTKSSTEVAYMLLDENGRPILENGKPKIEIGVKPSNVRVENIEQWRSVDDYKASEEQRIRENNRLTDGAMQMADEEMRTEEMPAESKAEEITDPQTTDELLALCKGDRELALDVAMDELNRAQQSKGKGANAAETMAINQRIRTYQRMVDELSKAEEPTPIEAPTEQTTDTQVTDDMEFIYQKDLGENHDGMEPMQLADGRYKWVGLQRGELTATMGERDTELLDGLAKKLGVAIIPIDVADSAVNGYYRDGNIYVNTNRGAEWTMRWVAGHEMLHDVAKKSPEAYDAYKQAVLDMWGSDYIDNQVKQIIDDYAASGKTIDREQALTELVNDFGGELFNSRDGLNILDNILKDESRKGNTGFVDTIKQWWERLKEWFGATPYYNEVEKKLADAYKEAIANAEEFRRNQEMDKGVSSVTDAARVEGAVIDFSIKTEPQVAQRLREYAESEDGKKHGWDKEKIEGIIDETEDLIDAIHNSLQGNQRYDAWADKNPTMRVDWRDGELKQTVTWSRGNVEYKYDMSADLLCINNEALEDVLASPAMVQIVRGMDALSKNGFTSDDYLRIYQVLRDKGFVVPCAGCFDAAARFKMLPSVAKNFADLVNKIVDERNADTEAFDAKVKAMAKGETTIEGLPTSAKTKEAAIRIGVAGDKLTEHITSEQLMSAQGQTDMLSNLGGIFRAWQRTGAGRPKDKLLPEPYVGDINSTTTTIIGAYGEKTPSYRDIYVNQGTGLRRNSHSEFRPLLAIDEIQFMRDAFAKGLTVFKYMKELDDVRLFGNMGVKFNMSFFPAFAKDGVAAGLDANGNYIASEESVGSREFAYMGEDGRTHFDGMKGWQEAQKYTNENVSLSSVVFSVPHLIKSLTDVPTPSDKSGMWGSLIPFHSSGATSAHLALQGLGRARANGVGHPFSEAMYDYNKGVTNFEDVQNDRFGEGWIIVEGKKAGTTIESGHKLEFANGTHMYNANLGVHLFKDGYIFDKDIKKKDNYGNGKVNTKNVKKYMTKFYVDYNDKVRELGGDYAYKDAADYYLRELPKIGLIPRFSFEVPESIYLEMCKAANVDPKHPKLGWKGEGNAWNPIDAESYYSLFCDYGMTDPKTGKWSPHKPIGNVDENGNRVFRLPDNAVQIVKDAVDKYSARRDKEESRINGVYEEFLKRSVKDGRLSEAEAQNLLSEISTDPNGGGGKPLDAEFSIKADKELEKKSLVGVHNLTEDNLRYALNLGGLANPSTAVIDTNIMGLEGFGDISLIMPKSLVAKSSGKNAGTFAGDAYTPRFPRGSIVKYMTRDGEKAVAKDYPGKDKFSQDFRSAIFSYGNEYGGITPTLYYMYKLENGGADIVKTDAPKFKSDKHKQMAEKFGQKEWYELSDAEKQELFDYKMSEKAELLKGEDKELVDKLISDYANTVNADDVAYEKLRTLQREYKKLQNADKIDYNATYRKAENDVALAGEQADFNKWLSQISVKYGIEDRIFRGFTPSGNRKYAPLTLANLSKVMKEQGRAGGESFMGKTPYALRAKMLPAFKTLESIRKNKGKIADEETYNKRRKEISSEYYDLISALSMLPNVTYDDAHYVLEDALTKGFAYAEKTANTKFDDAVKARTAAFGKLLTEAPSKYFETKFERAVMFNEFVAAIVPKDINPELRKALTDNGLAVEEYDRGDEASRLEAIRKASDRDDVQFSIKGGKNLEDRLESKYTQTRLRAARELAGDDESALMILDDLEPQTLEEYVAVQLGANGRKLLWENGKFSKGLKAHLGVSENEKKTYRSIISKDGYPPEVLAEEIWKSMPEEFYERYTDQDVFNTILDLASSYTRKQLKDFVVNRRIDAVIEFARKQEEWDAAQEEMYLETLSEQERNAYLANKEEMERVDKMSKKERAEYYKQKQVEQMLGEMTPEERAEYEAKEQWRKDNAAAITSSFFAERRLDKADKIQKLKDEINKLIKETRATNKENSEKVKEIAKEMQTYIKENIPTETQGDMTRPQFEQVMKQLAGAITRKDLEKPMRMVEYIGANANRRALTRQMRDFLKQGFKGMTPKGLVRAKNVDGATSRVLGLAKSLYESMGKQPLGSDLRALQTKVRGIKAELEDLNNANGGAFSEYVEQINAILKKSGVDRYEEMTKYYNELSDRQDVGEIQVSEVLDHINRMLPELFSIELVKEQRTQAKADSAMTTKEDLEQLKNNLEDKREKGILSEEDQAVLDNMAMYELMVDLQQRQLDIDGPGTSSIASQMAAKVREAKQYRDELEKYDDKKSGVAKNLKDNIKRVNAEMEELFVQRTQAQKEVNANVAELLDNLKQLRDTGNSALKEWSKNKQERETRIVTMANASFGKDARGYWSEVDRRGGWKRDFSNRINNLRLAALMSPALSFEYMVGVMDPRYYTNESPIYKQFIKGEDGLIKANDNFFEGLESFNNGINEAVERFINRNAMQSLKEYFNRGDRFATEIIPFEFEVKENVNGEVVTSIVHRDAEMTRGRAAKIYAWSRMADGMAKLKAHGVTDETLEVVKAFIGQDYMDFIDWVEDEYFPKLRREKYNPIYKQMYGISMAENEHYFPFETYKKDIRTEKELEQINSDNLGGGIVGNIIERKRNNARLDFTDKSPDIFDAISEYGRKMEEWAAYAQVREDLKKVINNKQFKQHCDMLGTNYYNHFLDAARVASRLYNPQPSAPQLQSAAAKLQKVFASAAISLRVSTALKQLLSAPAFAVYSLDPAFHKELLKTASVIDVESAIKGLRELASGNKAEAKKLLLEENWVGHYNWCVNNLPSFRERVSKGGAGNPILEEKGWSKFSDDVQSVGMLPNRLVDAFTCSVGAKAIYEYAFNKYKKTYDEATAHNMAVTDAEIAFNSSQQSSNPAFLSPLQSSKEFWLRGIMNYKNSPIGYYRAGMKANIDLYRATKALFGKPKFTINGEQVGFESNGVNPAAKAAEAAAKSIMFNFFLNYLWAFGTIGIAGASYTMMNNDNENGNLLYTDEEFDKATGGNMGLAVFNAATQGIPWVSGFASVSQTGQDYTPSILFSEMNNYLEQVNKEGFMSLATAQLFIDLGLKNAVGVDPEVWGQIYRGAQGIMADRPMRTEDFMNLLASPRSAIAGVAKQKVGEYNNMQDYVNARIESEREIGINETMDLGKKLTGLRPLRKSKLDGYIDEYLADKIPDYRELANKPDEKAKDERMEESNAFKNLNTLVSTVRHTEEKKKSSKKIDGNEETKDKVKKIRKAVNVIHKLYASGDASLAQRIADELERRLKRGYNANGATLDDKLKNVDIYDSTGTTEQRGTDGFDTMFDRAMLGGFDGVYLGSKLD